MWLVSGLFALAAVTVPQKAVGSTEVSVSGTRPVEPVILRVHRGPVTASFRLANDASIRLGTNTNASLPNLAVGETAHVAYTIENGQWLAHAIVVDAPHGSHKENALTSTAANMLHAHGRILAYNASTGSLTIKWHR